MAECKIIFVVLLHKLLMIPQNGSPGPENTNLQCKGKYHCTTDLPFDLFRFSCYANERVF